MKKTTTISPAVHAANDLTGQWCARLGDEDFVASGAGLWPLLALLASAADETAASELAAAIGRPAESAVQDALELISLLRAGESTTAALGLWTRRGLPLHEEWASQLPAGVIGTLTDQAALDRWASQETSGLIEKFPLELTPEMVMVLASALAAKVKWCAPFDARPRSGDWKSTEPDQQWLSRVTHDLAAAAVLDGAVTRVIVEGDGDVDVHLLLGDSQPADVLGAGLGELSGEAEVCPATEFKGRGPGLQVRRVESWEPYDSFRLDLPSFEITARHDLMEYADLFGLRPLTDLDTSHLPQLSPVPLSISEGAQSVLARFFAEGFEAAAVTAFSAIVTGGAPVARYTVTRVNVDFDRPFGFIAVHRPSRLAVVAGWVSSPFQEGSSQ
ncbi:MAG TPA: serpin family protein [Mycobacterium sp.]|mgnify:CR=1 FL=1|nr:serpin family protein [Mycobacterium sp.]HQC76611.1 serpin family protein [Mycobacterium sp.]